ncbi:MAG: hypothetical protein ACR2FV_09695 [Ornithinimicrobium sp.]|jgi:hypothetical protein|uniref:hypothetical protein n=1 Tax=Ornithinimicrobium sp. TaxID=1977084 RepID=UPI003D9B4068
MKPSTLRTTRDHLQAEAWCRLSAWCRRPDRGDVPGWVLITVMTAGLVAVLWALAQPLLTSLFSDAVSGVSGP